MASVTTAYMREIVTERYPSDRVKAMPDYQIAAIYQRIVNAPKKQPHISVPRASWRDEGYYDK